ncbi:hypothetical protein RJ55_06928 [Drechmeria coniospora]|nr:hypothetical protein RJ55_06928 [Drechmeria coniospora]
MRTSRGQRAAALLALLSSFACAVEPPREAHQPTGNGQGLLTFNETVEPKSLSPSLQVVRWATWGVDGAYVNPDEDGNFVLYQAGTGEPQEFVTADKLVESANDYWVSHDNSTVLTAINATNQYRYSFRADYFVIDVRSGSRKPLVDDQAGDIQYAVFAPRGRHIAFVRGNNIYLRNGDGEVTKLTSDGDPDLYHGVPDWVYEEEILSSRSALWFSPDGASIAFLSFNETGVGTSTVPRYTDRKHRALPYPAETRLRYPKAGTRNPTVGLSIIDVSSKKLSNVPLSRFPDGSGIVGEVAWVTDGHAALVYRIFNRVQDRSRHVLVNMETGHPRAFVVRERDSPDGWLDNSMAMRYVGKLEGRPDDGKKYYADLSDESGWTHIYLYPTRSNSSIQLTDGDWEVEAILHVDACRGLVYYTAAKRHGTERHVYSVSPNVPYQEVRATDGGKALQTLTANADVHEALNEYKLPNITYFELQRDSDADRPNMTDLEKEMGGYKLNVMQILPPAFNPAKKYPVLFCPYGGPNSQAVLKSFQPYDWKTYIASDPELQFVIYVVDNRGTGFQGRRFRSVVARQLGKLEADDQIWAAKELIKTKGFIDDGHVGIFGWSYGAFVAAKAIEKDDGVFTFGLAAAPMIDPRLYDFMYIERYMKTPGTNAAGYEEAAVRRAAGFQNLAGAFSVAHGMADDNVHFQNTAALVDVLIGDGLSSDRLRMMAFPDSDHTIAHHGAWVYLHKFFTARLWDELQRTSDARKTHQWSKKESPEARPEVR